MSASLAQPAPFKLWAPKRVLVTPSALSWPHGVAMVERAVALGAERPASGQGLLAFFVGVSAAAVAIALLVWLAYRSADWVANKIGAAARRTVSRMSAFLLLCIGVQILVNGIAGEVLRFMSMQH